MIDDALSTLQGLALLGLLASHYLLVKGCFGIRESIPTAGGAITERLDKTTDLLDEVAELLNEAVAGVAGSAEPPTMPASPVGVILNALMSRPPMEPNYGTSTQRPIQDITPPNPTHEVHERD